MSEETLKYAPPEFYAFCIANRQEMMANNPCYVINNFHPEKWRDEMFALRMEWFQARGPQQVLQDFALLGSIMAKVNAEEAMKEEDRD